MFHRVLELDASDVMRIPAIEFRNVSISFNGAQALRNVSFTLHRGEMIVVLIVGIGLSWYIVYKFFGEKVGLLIGGVLGGLISSTATTVSYSRRTARDPDSVRSAAIVITVASAIVFHHRACDPAFSLPSARVGELGGGDVRSRVLLRDRAGNLSGLEHSALGP
jgi:hypothetical protein